MTRLGDFEWGSEVEDSLAIEPNKTQEIMKCEWINDLKSKVTTYQNRDMLV